MEKIKYNTNNFPVFKSVDDVRCYLCKGKVTHMRESGFLEGHGAHKSYCPKCDTPMWYDLEKEERDGANENN